VILYCGKAFIVASKMYVYEQTKKDLINDSIIWTALSSQRTSFVISACGSTLELSMHQDISRDFQACLLSSAPYPLSSSTTQP